MRRFFTFSLIVVLLPACSWFQPLDKKLISSDEKTRQAAIKELVALPFDRQAALTAPLIKKLRDPDGRIVNRATEALVIIGAPSVDGLRAHLHEPDPFVRMSVISALGRLGPLAQSAIPGLIAALKDPHPLVCEEAVFALGQMGSAAESAGPALLDSLKSGNDDLKLAIVDSLKKIGIRPPPVGPRARSRIS